MDVNGMEFFIPISFFGAVAWIVNILVEAYRARQRLVLLVLGIGLFLYSSRDIPGRAENGVFLFATVATSLGIGLLLSGGGSANRAAGPTGLWQGPGRQGLIPQLQPKLNNPRPLRPQQRPELRPPESGCLPIRQIEIPIPGAEHVTSKPSFPTPSFGVPLLQA